MDLEHIITAVISIAGTGMLAWYVALRKLKPEIDAIQASADEAYARKWKALSDAQQERIDQLDTRATAQDLRIATQDERIAAQDKLITDLLREIDQIKLARQHTADDNEKLRYRVKELENEANKIPSMVAENEKLRQQIIKMEIEIKRLRAIVLELGGKLDTGPLKVKP